MKKFLATGILAIGVIALSQQQASAWINARFGIGFSIGWQSGGNNLGWGAWQNGQPPGPQTFSGSQGYYQSYSFPQFYVPHSHGAIEPQAPAPAPSYAPYHYATYPRPVYYYYPAPTYDYYGQ